MRSESLAQPAPATWSAACEAAWPSSTGRRQLHAQAADGRRPQPGRARCDWSATAIRPSRRCPSHAVATKEVERRAVDAVLARRARRSAASPRSMPHNNPGFDIRSTGDRTGTRSASRSRAGSRRRRTSSSPATRCSRQERRAALPPGAGRVIRDGPEHDQVRYLADPFGGVDLGDFDATGDRVDWARPGRMAPWSPADERATTHR